MISSKEAQTAFVPILSVPQATLSEQFAAVPLLGIPGHKSKPAFPYFQRWAERG